MEESKSSTKGKKLKETLGEIRQESIKVLIVTSPALVINIVIVALGLVPFFYGLMANTRTYLIIWVIWIALVAIGLFFTYASLFTGTYVLAKPVFGWGGPWDYLLWTTSFTALGLSLFSLVYLLYIAVTIVVPWLYFVFLAISTCLAVVFRIYTLGIPHSTGIATVVMFTLPLVGGVLDYYWFEAPFKLFVPEIFVALGAIIYFNLRSAIDLIESLQ